MVPYGCNFITVKVTDNSQAGIVKISSDNVTKSFQTHLQRYLACDVLDAHCLPNGRVARYG